MNTIKDYSVMEQKLEALCMDAISRNNLELYDVEYIDHDQTLRLFIENPETKTATLDECRSVDRALTEAIEAADFIGDQFVLEVSSPGVYRHMRTQNHFEKAVGQRAVIYFKTKATIEGKVEKRMTGLIDSVQGSELTVKEIEEVKSASYTVTFDNIKKANVEPHWNDIKQ